MTWWQTWRWRHRVPNAFLAPAAHFSRVCHFISFLWLFQIFIADRSPFSAVYYANHGALLEPVIREQMREVMENADVEMLTVYLQVGQWWTGGPGVRIEPCTWAAG